MGFQNEKIIKGIDKLLILCLLVIIYLAFFSCTTQKKATRYFNENNKELAELCLERFPIREKTIRGDTIRITDTLKVIDKVPVFVDCPDGTKKECPPKEIKYIKTTEQVTDTIIKIDTRNEAILKHDIKELTEDNKTLKKQRKGLIYLCVGLLLVLIVSRIFK